MAAGRELLLLAVILLLVVRCQPKPTVSMIPGLEQIFTGDFFSLECEDGQSGSPVTWYLNDSKLEDEKNITLKIAAASTKHSGDYKCRINGQDSDNFPIHVYEFVPIASLTISTGQPVMRKNSIVLLELTNDDGLQGWMCRVNRGNSTKRVILKLGDGNPTSFIFETAPLIVPETIYWCVKKKAEKYRSNQVVLRTTEKEVTLEMYPFPAILGEKMTLRCLVWGAEKVLKSVFLKDGVKVTGTDKPEFDIIEAEESTEGRYKCEATYRYKDQTVTPHKYDSDAQEVLVHDRPVRAELSDSMGCSCPSCDSAMERRFYKQNGHSWTMLPDRPSNDGGTYCCRFSSEYMRTLPSNAVNSSHSNSGLVIGILVFIILVGLFIVLVALHMWNKKRRAAVDIYEQVPMRGDPNYEALNVEQVKEGEYDTLQTEAEGRQKTGGEYQALKKQEGKDEVYHTLGEASGGGEGGYEALKTAGVKKDEYDTLKTKQAGDGPGTDDGEGGGYEALKTAGVKKDEYDTLKTEQKQESE